jgi:chaperonin cofactor prefoldin
MEHIRQIEALVAILLVSFETQIQSIQLLNRHQMRPMLIHHTKTLIEALLRSIEDIEHQFVEQVESNAEQLLGQSATLAKTISEAKDEMPEVEVLQELAKIAKSSHRSLTSSLAEGEKEVTEEMTDRFTKMKNKIKALLLQIELL